MTRTIEWRNNMAVVNFSRDGLYLSCGFAFYKSFWVVLPSRTDKNPNDKEGFQN